MFLNSCKQSAHLTTTLQSYFVIKTFFNAKSFLILPTSLQEKFLALPTLNSVFVYGIHRFKSWGIGERTEIPVLNLLRTSSVRLNDPLKNFVFFFANWDTATSLSQGQFESFMKECVFKFNKISLFSLFSNTSMFVFIFIIESLYYIVSSVYLRSRTMFYSSTYLMF